MNIGKNTPNLKDNAKKRIFNGVDFFIEYFLSTLNLLFRECLVLQAFLLYYHKSLQIIVEGA